MAAEPGLSTFELLTIIGSVAAGTAAICTFLFTGANSIRKEFWKAIEPIKKWQARHERKDDRKFAILDSHLASLSVRNAIKDHTALPKHRPINDIVDEELNGDEETD